MHARPRPKCSSRSIAGAWCGPDRTMTRFSDPSEFRTGSKAEPVGRLVAWSRAALAWERVWPGLWPASGIAGLLAGVGLFHLFRPPPGPGAAPGLSPAIPGIWFSAYFRL